MSLVNIISAIGNNSSIYPLLIRDCGIENPIKFYLRKLITGSDAEPGLVQDGVKNM